MADVGLGKVGIVLGIEVSRLARNNADWYHLLDLCALTDTLIADADGIYHPADFNDRLVLGLKGTMSEAELHLIRSRLTAGLRHKAAKGELRQGLPVGLDYDADSRVVITPGRGGAGGDHGRVRPLRRARLGPAGAAEPARGRAAASPPRQRIHPDPVGASDLSGGARLPDQPGLCGRVRVRPHPHREARRCGRPADHPGAAAPRDEWAVLIPDHHLGFIGWAQYETNTAQLRRNWQRTARPWRRRGPRRRGDVAGPAALRPVRADHADRLLRHPRRLPRYVCGRAKQLYGGEHVCQSIGGRRLEKTVLDKMFAMLEPATLSGALRARIASGNTRHAGDASGTPERVDAIQPYQAPIRSLASVAIALFLQLDGEIEPTDCDRRGKLSRGGAGLP